MIIFIKDILYIYIYTYFNNVLKRDLKGEKTKKKYHSVIRWHLPINKRSDPYSMTIFKIVMTFLSVFFFFSFIKLKKSS